MPPRNAPQTVVKPDNAGEHGRPRATCAAEDRPQILRLYSSEMVAQRQLTGDKPFLREASPRDVEENTDFYSVEPNRQFSNTSRTLDDVTQTILSRHQRSQSVGANNTCYVVHDAEGKPVLRLITNGLAISKKFGAANVPREPSQSSDMSKEQSTVVDNEQIVLMLGDSAKSGKSWARGMYLEQRAADRKDEQAQPAEKENSRRRRHKKRAPKQAYSSENQEVEPELSSGRRRRKKRAPQREYSSEIHELEEDLGSFRRHSRRERRYSKDSLDSVEDIEKQAQQGRLSDNRECRSERSSGHQQNNKLGSRSQAHAYKSEELYDYRGSKNRSARIDDGKESSLLTSYEEATQEPRSSISAEFLQASTEAQEDAFTLEGDETGDDTTVSGSDKGSDSKRSSVKSSGKDKSKSGTPPSDGGKKKSVSIAESASNNKPKRKGPPPPPAGKGAAAPRKGSAAKGAAGKGEKKGSAAAAGKGDKKGSASAGSSRGSADLGKPADAADKKRKSSAAGAKGSVSRPSSEASDKPGARKRSASATSAGAGKGPKGKPPEKGKPGRKDSKAKPEKKKKDDTDAGMVQGLVTEGTQDPSAAGPPPEDISQTPEPSVFATPFETPPLEESVQPTREPSPEPKPVEPPPAEPPKVVEPPPAEEPESESLGTIIYQHVARYICIGLLRVAGGVRIVFDVAERQAYVQIISPLCEVYVTYYANNMTFLTSTSAAGVAWAAAVYRKKDAGKGKEPEKDAGNAPAKKGKDNVTHEDLQARLERCRFPEASKSMIDTAHVVFCDPYQAQRFKTVLETLKSAMECTNTLITPCMPFNNYLGCSGLNVVPCTMIDPTAVQRPCPCPPPLPPPCCSMPFGAPGCNVQYQQNPCQGMPFGGNPCVGAEVPPYQNYCSQPSMFPCPNTFMNPSSFANQGQLPNQPENNLPAILPSPAPPTPGFWSQFSSPHSSLFATPNPAPANLQTGNDMVSEPQTPEPYSQYSDPADNRGRIRFNPNVTVFQSESRTGTQDATIRPNFCANVLPNMSQMGCYDPYAYENCFGKTLFCAPACLVRLNNEMAWTDLQKGCMKIYQCPSNGGFSLVLENNEKAITTHHYLTADTVFIPSDKTQFGFTYTTVTRNDNKGTFVDHFLVSFMNCRTAEQFKCMVDGVIMTLKSTTDDWSGAPCPSKSIRNWQGYVG